MGLGMGSLEEVELLLGAFVGDVTGLRRIATKNRFIANDTATVCASSMNAHKCGICRRRPGVELASLHLNRKGWRLLPTFHAQEDTPRRSPKENLLSPPISPALLRSNLPRLPEQLRILQPPPQL